MVDVLLLMGFLMGYNRHNIGIIDDIILEIQAAPSLLTPRIDR